MIFQLKNFNFQVLIVCSSNQAVNNMTSDKGLRNYREVVEKFGVQDSNPSKGTKGNWKINVKQRITELEHYKKVMPALTKFLVC